jgi:hypothetical protein
MSNLDLEVCMGRGWSKRKQYQAGQWMAWPVVAVAVVTVLVLVLDWLGAL